MQVRPHPVTGASAPGPAPRRALLLGIAALTLVADQATKAWALRALADGVRRPVLGDLFGLQLIANSGAAFSLASGQTWLLTLVAVVIGGFVVTQLSRITNRWWAVAVGLVLGGLLGNLWDRLARPPSVGQGHVVDFLAYGSLFIGNVADIAIVGAALGLALLAAKDVPFDERPSAAPLPGADNGDHA